MIKTTLWRPDTCGCEIEYTWDTNTTEDLRVHELLRIKSKCEHHAGLLDAECHNQVKKENLHKNHVIGAILETINELTDEYVDEDGATKKKFKRGAEPKWGFDKNRKLQIFPVNGPNYKKIEIDKIIKDKKNELGII